MICPTANAIVFAIKPKCLWDNSWYLSAILSSKKIISTAELFLPADSLCRGLGWSESDSQCRARCGKLSASWWACPGDELLQPADTGSFRFYMSVHCASNPNLNFLPTNVTRSTLNNQKTFKMSKIKSLMEKVSRFIVLMLPWDLHCLHRSTHNRRIQYQRGLKTRCLFLFSLLFWPCQTNSSSRCPLPKESR